MKVVADAMVLCYNFHMDNKLTATELATWRTFITAHASVIDAIERDLSAAQQLPLSSYDVLIELAEAPEQRLRMRDLAQSVVLSRSGLTRLVDRLAAEGLLEREVCVTDRRGAYAVLTVAGREALGQAWPVYAQGIRRHFIQHLTEEEQATLTVACERVLHQQQ